MRHDLQRISPQPLHAEAGDLREVNAPQSSRDAETYLARNKLVVVETIWNVTRLTDQLTRMMKQPSCLRGRRWKLRHWQQSTKQVSYVLVRAMYVLKKYHERGIKF